MMASLFACKADPQKLIAKKWTVNKVEVIVSDKEKQNMKDMDLKPEVEIQNQEKMLKETISHITFDAAGKYELKSNKGSWKMLEEGKALEMTAEGSKTSNKISIEQLTAESFVFMDANNPDVKVKVYLQAAQ